MIRKQLAINRLAKPLLKTIFENYLRAFVIIIQQYYRQKFQFILRQIKIAA